MPNEIPENHVLRCAICGLPYARIVNGTLVIESRHHGETHTNVIAVSEVTRIAQGNAQSWPPQMEIKDT
jgi:hypothetical protein